MLTRYDRLELALERSGVSFHGLWESERVISQYTYRKIRRGIVITDAELLAIAEAVGWDLRYIKSLID